MPAQAWVTLIVGLVGVVGVVATLKQKIQADNRREWWARFQWAMDATYSADAQKRVDGWRVIAVLATSRLLTETEENLIQAVATDVAQDDTWETSSSSGVPDEPQA